MTHSTFITMDEVARLIGVSSGRKLFALLREKKVLNKTNIPYFKYREAGLFRNIIKSHTRGYGEHQYSQTLVSEKGISFIVSILSDEPEVATTVCSENPADEKQRAAPSGTERGTRSPS